MVKPDIYRQSGDRWKKCHEPKFLRNERKIIEEKLHRKKSGRENQQVEGFQQQTRRQEQWTVDPFWGVDRPQQPAMEEIPEQPGPSTLRTYQ